MTKMERIARDIIHLKIEMGDTLQTTLDKYYAILRKHGIKQGIPSYNAAGECIGRDISKFDWTLCMTLFLDRLIHAIHWHILIEGVPEDLEK